jgi:hypothetical protein
MTTEFSHTYDAGPNQPITHVGIVSRVDSSGQVWMIDAPDVGQVVREEAVAGYWADHFAGYRTVGGA